MSLRYSLDSLSGLVNDIYAASAAPDKWQPVLESIAGATGSSSACMPVVAPCGSPWQEVSHRVPDELREEYAAQLASIDKLSRFASEQPSFVGTTSDVFRQHPELYVPAFEERTRYYGLAERWGANISADRAVSLHRDAALGAYDREDKDFLNHLVPHLRNAFTIGEKLAHAEALSNSLLDRIGDLGFGVVLLDRQGKTALVNARADVIIRDSELLDVQHGRLRCQNDRANGELQRSVARILQGDSARQAIRIANRGASMEIAMAPFRWPRDKSKCPLTREPELIAFITDQDQSVDMDLKLFGHIYQLTPAEADVLYMLANDCTVSEIASIRHVGESTVRSHLKSLRKKTGLSRQTQLARLALTSVARLRQGDGTDGV